MVNFYGYNQNFEVLMSLSEWVSEWMSEWVSQSVSQSVSQWVSQSVSETESEETASHILVLSCRFLVLCNSNRKQKPELKMKNESLNIFFINVPQYLVSSFLS